MFVNVIKNRIVRWVIYAVLGTLCLYNGTSCVAALHKAGKQPYLLSGTERFDFVGYHMMAAMCGETINSSFPSPAIQQGTACAAPCTVHFSPLPFLRGLGTKVAASANVRTRSVKARSSMSRR